MKIDGWRRVRNVLCARLDDLGDVLMTTPAMRALKHTLPGCKVTLLASAGGAAGAACIPEIDDVITYAAPWMKYSGHADPQADIGMAQLLRSRGFDAAVIFTSYSQSPLPAAMLCHLAGIPLRLAHCRENPYHLLSDWIHETEPEQTVRHEVRRQLDLVGAVGCTTGDERLSFSVPHESAAWARRHLQAIGIDLTQPWLLLHPGATAPSRRYPPKLWAQALDLIAARLPCPIVFCGGDADVAAVEEIRDSLGCPSYSLAGRLDLGRFAAVVAQAPVLLANNSGPTHLAAAVGTPVIDLYALTNFQHAPWGVPHRVLYHDVACAPCYRSVCPQGHHDCLEKVSPARVASETLELLQETMNLQVSGRRAEKTGSTRIELQPILPVRNRVTGRQQQFEPLEPIVIRTPNIGFAMSKQRNRRDFRR